MHIVMFGDQHLESLGGAQVSMRLQKRFLEKAGHLVTVVAPRMHGPVVERAGGETKRRDETPAYLDLPSVPITLDREYSFTWPGRRTDRRLDRAMAARPPVDVVHVQADFWGAYIGHRFAARHGIPVVHTMHNRVDVGIEAVAPFPGVVLRALNAWQRRVLRSTAAGRDGWAYLRRFAELSAAVTVPSGHFARRLEQHGVVPGRSGGAHGVDVVWNGIDDDELDAVVAAAASETRRIGPDEEDHGPEVLASADSPRADASHRRPRFVWVGRMSAEKRLLPFLEALAESGVAADVEIIGGGGQLAAARKLVRRLEPAASVAFLGRLPYRRTLVRIAAADAVVQTSIGFETQGMTVFEAAALGTPSVISDPDIAAELGSGVWNVRDASTSALADALRRAAADIAAGGAPKSDPSVAERFRQSSRTAAMVAVYDRVIDSAQ